MRTLAEALGCREYYADGAWSGTNYDTGYRVFFSPEGNDGDFKTIVRSVYDVTEQTMYCLNGHGDLYGSFVPGGVSKYSKLVLKDSAAAVNRSARFDAVCLVRDAGNELSQSAEPDAKKAEYLDKGMEAVQVGGNYTIMANYYAAKGDAETALIYYGLAASEYVAAQQYAQAAMSESNPIFG